ncbi:ParB N-terminal domain-containing protein [Allokutzneria sp. A3M-2-11 16]|uniref:ParB/RepB/Spo0J family partition protein n=1 Tax=Allokutzneria sp. A3M-2-11 16 TaxID=2962043 RepID=UPI0020B6643D|nr:ParB N-terminal domain-containing protein [Allokutzneria sp. A3M-2-11 16]MCP3805291.1 ParB N-terminal domain-containing protein [Allokutzneria sp. A3M-2-11 16]
MEREFGSRKAVVSLVAVDELRPCVESPRAAGENLDHVRALAESGAALPPILVHRQTKRVIDGMHRLRATKARGQDHIAVTYFDGSDHDAFVLAVRANIAHGLPLTVAERSGAAARIIASHPQWSDRRIAAVVGVAPGTVSSLRKRTESGSARAEARVGRDGRIRPINSSEGRLLARELLTERPEASLREIAKAAGIAPSTVLDVRERMRAGQDVLPDRLQNRARRPEPVEAAPPVVDWEPVLQNLRRDPSLRFSEVGRLLLRWLDSGPQRQGELARVIDNVPPHCAVAVAGLARAAASSWREFADRLDRRAATATRHSS